MSQSRLSGGLKVERRVFAVPQDAARAAGAVHRAGRGHGSAAEVSVTRADRGGGLVRLVEQVLLHEPARVQVVEVEVLEFRAESLFKVRLRAFGYPAQVAQRTPDLGGDLGQFFRLY